MLGYRFMQLADTVYLLAGLAGEDRHAETFLLVSRIVTPEIHQVIPGEQPYAREFSYIPCAICPELHAQQVQSLGLYNSLKKYNIIPTRANEKLKAILLDQETAGMLDQRQNDAAIYLTRITYHNNVVIEKNISYVRGDMFVYSVELSVR